VGGHQDGSAARREVVDSVLQNLRARRQGIHPGGGSSREEHLRIRCQHCPTEGHPLLPTAGQPRVSICSWPWRPQLAITQSCAVAAAGGNAIDPGVRTPGSRGSRESSLEGGILAHVSRSAAADPAPASCSDSPASHDLAGAWAPADCRASDIVVVLPAPLAPSRPRSSP